ncbi:HAD family hydrolase [Lachnoclostridium phytofermentans]|uniref:HAD-superfamily hydrolase, subfamily IA, variant 1 n=1 Tax=Lachnoclostridium phytofermentans (strain ATCC 700394 / DSM 18823 / ISDg) TaxID=357809 RepID=A9KSP1_LACP7|nr:HAD family hydrolase [Lachnoclostridium phytofermentans]ABX43693.1 HAD-superfamily hydrolase, subfamily IA, variant 1 [Lachnoclostridium phytofermentans ISDg]
MRLAAILWDYDGTLVDSTKKNIRVTKEVLKHFIPEIEQHMPIALTSIDEYQKANYKYKNWKELYEHAYGLSMEQIEEAGKLWSPYQLQDDLNAELFQGLLEIIPRLPVKAQGICSQNSSKNIENTLDSYGLASFFPVIIGVDEVGFNEQKPNPSGYLKCLSKLGVDYEDSVLIYIGDHAEDVIFAKNAEKCLLEQLSEKNTNSTVKIITIGVNYSGSDASTWVVKPDYVVTSPKEIESIITEIIEN